MLLKIFISTECVWCIYFIVYGTFIKIFMFVVIIIVIILYMLIFLLLPLFILILCYVYNILLDLNKHKSPLLIGK